MTPTHANKRGRRYRYYISSSLLDPRKAGSNSMRVPASEIDGLIVDRLRVLVTSPQEIADILTPLSLKARELDAALVRADAISRDWLTIAPEELRALARSVIVRVVLSLDRIEVTIGVKQLAHALGSSVNAGNETGPTIVLSIAAELRRAGQGMRLVIGEPNLNTSDASLVDFLKEAFAARQMLLAETGETLNEITARTTKSKGRMTALMRVSYLAPDIVSDILAGRQPPELSVKRLVRTSQNLPLDWGSQRDFSRHELSRSAPAVREEFRIRPPPQPPFETVALKSSKIAKIRVSERLRCDHGAANARNSRVLSSAHRN